MSVSDQSSAPAADKPSHSQACIVARGRDWKAIRKRYELGPLTLRQFSDAEKIPIGTLFKRSAKEQWKKPSKLLAIASGKIEEKINQAVAGAIERAVGTEAEGIAAKVMAELQPWIEAKKAEHIKKAVDRGEKHLARIDKQFTTPRKVKGANGEDIEEEITLSPKDEAFIARAIDGHDNIIRRNLGMTDANSTPSALNVAILAGGRTAIQINHSGQGAHNTDHSLTAPKPITAITIEPDEE